MPPNILGVLRIYPKASAPPDTYAGCQGKASVSLFCLLLLTRPLWLPSALRTKSKPYDMAFRAPPLCPSQASPSGTPTMPKTQQFQEPSHCFRTPSPAAFARVELSCYPGCPPPPGPGRGSCEGSGVGSEAVSCWGRRGLWPSPASAGPLPSFPGSSLGPERPHVPWLALVPGPGPGPRLHPQPAFTQLWSLLPACKAPSFRDGGIEAPIIA